MTGISSLDWSGQFRNVCEEDLFFGGVLLRFDQYLVAVAVIESATQLRMVVYANSLKSPTEHISPRVGSISPQPKATTVNAMPGPR